MIRAPKTIRLTGRMWISEDGLKLSVDGSFYTTPEELCATGRARITCTTSGFGATTKHLMIDGMQINHVQPKVGNSWWQRGALK